MQSNALLDAVAADLRAQLPALKTCEAHDGSWDPAEVKRWAVQTPAMLIAWLGTIRTDTPGASWTDCEQQLGAFVVTRDGRESGGLRRRGEAVRNLVDWLLLYVPRARWGLAGLGAAEELRARNLYSSMIDKTGIAMWLVSWQQTLRLEAAEDGTCPPLPEELYASAQEDPHEAIWPEET